MKTSLKVIACMAVLAVLVAVQSPAEQGKLEGVWKAVEATTAGENAVKITVPPNHPGLLIFTKKYTGFWNIAACPCQ